MQWKPIPDHEGLYEASDNGQVRSLPRKTTSGKILTQRQQNRGYCMVTTSKDGKRKELLVHRVVWEAFNGKIPPGYEINHKDENRLNNKLDNLELLTHRDNINYGLHNKKQRYAQPKRKGVIAYDKITGKKIREFDSLRHAVEVLNLDSRYFTNIAKCCNGKTKSACGYIWKYKNIK